MTDKRLAKLIQRAINEEGFAFREMADGGLLVEFPDVDDGEFPDVDVADVTDVAPVDELDCFDDRYVVFEAERRGEPLRTFLRIILNCGEPLSNDILDRYPRYPRARRCAY